MRCFRPNSRRQPNLHTRRRRRTTSRRVRSSSHNTAAPAKDDGLSIGVIIGIAVSAVGVIIASILGIISIIIAVKYGKAGLGQALRHFVQFARTGPTGPMETGVVYYDEGGMGMSNMQERCCFSSIRESMGGERVFGKIDGTRIKRFWRFLKGVLVAAKYRPAQVQINMIVLGITACYAPSMDARSLFHAPHPRSYTSLHKSTTDSGESTFLPTPAT